MSDTTAIKVVVILAVVIIGSTALYVFGTRYQLSAGDSTYLVDKITGKTWWLFAGDQKPTKMNE